MTSTSTPNRSLFQNSSSANNNQNTLRTASNLNTSSYMGGNAALDVRSRQEIASLKSERDRLVRENKTLEDKLKSSTAKTQQLEMEKAAALRKNNDSESLRDKIKSYENRIKELNDRLNAAQTEKHEKEKALQLQENESHVTIEQWRAAAKKAETHAKSLERQNQIDQESISNRDTRISELELVVSTRDDTIQALQEEIRGIKSDLEDITHTRDSFERENAANKQYLAETLEKLSQKEDECARALDKISAGEEDRTGLEEKTRLHAQEVSTLNNKISQHLEELSNKDKEIAALRAQVQNLEGTIQTGVRDLTSSRNETRVAKEGAKVLQQRLEHVENDLSRSYATDKELREKISSQKAQISSQADQLANRAVEVQSISDEVASLKLRIKDLEVQLRDKEKFARELHDVSQSAASKTGDHLSNIRSLEGQIVVLQEDIKKNTERHAVDCKSLQDEIDERNHTIARLENQVTALENTAKESRTDLTNKNTDFVTRIEHLEGQLQTKEVHIARIEERCSNMQKKLDEVHETLENTSNALATAKEELDNTREARNHLQNQLDQVQTQLETDTKRFREESALNARSFTASATSAAEAARAMASELDNSRESLRTMDSRIKTLESTITDHEQTIATLTKKLKESQEEATALTIKFESANSEAAEFKVRNEELGNRLAEVFANNSAKESDLENFSHRIQEYQEKEKKFDAQIEELRVIIQEKEDKIRAGENGYSALKNEIIALEGQVRDLQSQNAQILQQVQEGRSASEFEQKYEAAKAQYHEQINATATMKQQMERFVEAKEQDIVDLAEKLSKAEEAIKTHNEFHKAELHRAKKEAAELKEQLEASQQTYKNDVEKLESEIEKRKEKHREVVEYGENVTKRLKKYKDAYQTVFAKLETSEKARNQDLASFQKTIAVGKSKYEQLMAKYQEQQQQSQSQSQSQNQNSVAAAASSQQQQQQRPREQQYYQKHSDVQSLEDGISRISHQLMSSNNNNNNQQNNNNNNNNNMMMMRRNLGGARNAVIPDESGAIRQRYE